MEQNIRRALTGTVEQPTLTFERTYRATPAELRDACTSPKRLQGWLGHVHGKPSAIGDEYTVNLSDNPKDTARGRVLRCDDDSFTVTWKWDQEQDSTVTVTFTPSDDEHTILTLQHTLAEAETTVDYGGGWEWYLQGLDHTFGGAEPGAEMSPESLSQWRMMTDQAMSIEHVTPAPIDQVWAAFTNADGLKKWWWSHWNDVEVTGDFRSSGDYRIAAPGVGIALSGRFLTLDSTAKHLAYTWIWESEGEVSADEAVDIRFEAVDGGTRLTIRHSGPWADDAPATSYREGWLFTLSQLDAMPISGEK